MIYQISNEYLTVSIQSQGAMLTSVRDAKTGREYLWQGDPKYWKGQAPNLFPFVGRLTEQRYTLSGVSYDMTRHGFVRGSEMRPETLSDTVCALILTDNEETRQIYPFRFLFRIRYTLKGDTLSIDYEVENRGDQVLYCGMGGHPGFNVPMEEGLSFEDYELRFPEACHPHQVLFGPTLQVTEDRPEYPLENDIRIPLTHDLFDIDAVVLADAPRSVTLGSPKSAHGITVSYPVMPYVGFWHQPKTDAPYVCIEPWAVLPGRENVVEDLTTLPDVITVEPGKTFKNPWSIRIF